MPTSDEGLYRQPLNIEGNIGGTGITTDPYEPTRKPPPPGYHYRFQAGTQLESDKEGVARDFRPPTVSDPSLRWDPLKHGYEPYTAPRGGTSGAPAGGRKGLSITAGEYDDYMGIALSIMHRAGIYTREPNDDEIVQFAQAKMNADSIDQFYRNLPEFTSKQPGLPYDLSKGEYERQRSEVERAAAEQFGTPESGDLSAASEPGYLKEAFKERMSPAEVEAGLADQFRRLGKQPTAKDVASFRTRPKMRTEEDMVSVGGQAAKPGISTTPEPVSPFSRRR